jgi:hypothetical protein
LIRSWARSIVDLQILLYEWCDRRYHAMMVIGQRMDQRQGDPDPTCRIMTRNLCTFRAQCLVVHQPINPSLLCVLVVEMLPVYHLKREITTKMHVQYQLFLFCNAKYYQVMVYKLQKNYYFSCCQSDTPAIQYAENVCKPASDQTITSPLIKLLTWNKKLLRAVVGRWHLIQGQSLQHIILPVNFLWTY